MCANSYKKLFFCRHFQDVEQLGATDLGDFSFSWLHGDFSFSCLFSWLCLMSARHETLETEVPKVGEKLPKMHQKTRPFTPTFAHVPLVPGHSQAFVHTDHFCICSSGWCLHLHIPTTCTNTQVFDVCTPTTSTDAQVVGVHKCANRPSFHKFVSHERRHSFSVM